MDVILGAVILGLANGLSPGPTLALLISQTLSSGLRYGIAIACSPLIFAIVIIPVIVLFSTQVKNVNLFLAIISFCGALYLFRAGYHDIKVHKNVPGSASMKAIDIKTMLLINFLSPYAYIFWFTTGMTMISTAVKESNFLLLSGFIGAYYFCLVGSKVLVAIIVNKFGNVLNRDIYIVLMKALGVLILIIGIIMLIDSFKYFSSAIGF